MDSLTVLVTEGAKVCFTGSMRLKGTSIVESVTCEVWIHSERKGLGVSHNAMTALYNALLDYNRSREQ